MQIELADRATDELLDALTRLIPQLKISSPRLTRDALAGLLASDATSLLTARDEAGRILGALTLVCYRTPTGVRARIEDVVVDEPARGRGVAAALVERALEIARGKGADGVALTSNPRREAANRLYRKVGFKRWETNVYFYRFD
ncbi:MAG: GNAT family N-acetyltransferase [Chloroflexota bacterium]